MPIFSKESLETLRQRIDLVEVLSSQLEMKRSGVVYKALCPFHDEKTPSFMVQKGDSHYHCFGCGAHGDAIQFLMSHAKMGFSEAVENLAQRFNVPLQTVEGSDEKKGPNKAALKEALESACLFYHFILLHTEEGHNALSYLFNRGIDIDFIRRFRLGLAPNEQGLLRKVLHAHYIKDEVMEEVGLLSPGRESRYRDFFHDRITFPICDHAGAVIGFSARKYKETTYGGKYVNTPETPLFKKSRVLFGLNYCRRRIAKERKAIVVEGQIDALRMISAGFNITVAGQGTAFGEGHVKELLNLGVNQVYLAMDSDEAGLQATYKIGDLFQKEGVAIRVVQLPQRSDPDAFLREKGAEAFVGLMESSLDYMSFAVNFMARSVDMTAPAGKNELVQAMVKQIRAWNHPLMVHESLRKLAHLTNIPESMIGVGEEHIPNIHVRRTASIGLQAIDPDRIRESDFLRWLVLAGQENTSFFEIARTNLKGQDLRDPLCRKIYQAYLDGYAIQQVPDLLSLSIQMEKGQEFFEDLLKKKVNKDRSEQQFHAAIQTILEHNWMSKREEIRVKIQSGNCSDEEAILLMKQFDELKNAPPKVQLEITLPNRSALQQIE